MTAVLVTGATGFIGRNLCVRLAERGDLDVIAPGHADGGQALAAAAGRADFVFHLAGVNRPGDETEFATGNTGFTSALTAALAAAGNRAPIVFASSRMAAAETPYGRSKRDAEDVLRRHGTETGAPVHILRLTNIFGKWARPNYNSGVATFCHNIARGLAITIHDPAARLDLCYIDDLVDAFVKLLDSGGAGSSVPEVSPVYSTTVGAVADIVRSFPSSRETLITPRAGTGLVRALYATYLSYLEPADFAYALPVHADARGRFVEMVKTPDSGQFSYFTAGPGVTRGNHYHHSKVEKFLVISGTAHFGFRHIMTDEAFEIVVHGTDGRVVETTPGWTHNITNIGDGELTVMLWANEIFEPDRPDTIGMKV